MAARKNYYEILEVFPGSPIETIKKSYRKLALQMHPDTNPDAEAAQKFHLIQEAYSVLSNPEKKYEYDINNGFYSKASEITAGMLVQEVLTLNRFVKNSDTDRMDKEALVLHISKYIQPEYLDLVKKENDTEGLEQYLWLILDSSTGVSHKYLGEFFYNLTEYEYPAENIRQTIEKFRKQSESRYRWEKWSPWLVLALTLLLCVLIFYLSGR
jgi:curved DNA-binding protein CbpA